jgi:serine/threonine protein kinase
VRCLKFRARRRDTGALRFLKQATGAESKKLLENEAAALAAVSHPHLIKLHQTHQRLDRLMLEFEYVEAAQLRFPLGIERLCRIMLQVAELLGALHQRGFVHGDVKPQNVLFRSGGSLGDDDVVLSAQRHRAEEKDRCSRPSLPLRNRCWVST